MLSVVVVVNRAMCWEVLVSNLMLRILLVLPGFHGRAESKFQDHWTSKLSTLSVVVLLEFRSPQWIYNYTKVSAAMHCDICGTLGVFFVDGIPASTDPLEFPSRLIPDCNHILYNLIYSFWNVGASIPFSRNIHLPLRMLKRKRKSNQHFSRSGRRRHEEDKW